MTVMLIVAVLPVYITAHGLVDCRYGWSATAAFLVPYTDSNGGHWVVGPLIVGAFGFGGVLLPVLVIVGRKAGLVATESGVHVSMNNPYLDVNGPAKDRLGWRQTAFSLFVVTTTLLLLLASTLGINVVFVLLQESSRLNSASKSVLLVVFSIIHDLINHFAGPLAVTTVARVVSIHRSPRVHCSCGCTCSPNALVSPRQASVAHPGFVISASVAFALTNSLVAPMLALLLVSTGCFRDKLFGSEPTVSTSVSMATCVGSNTFSCVTYGHYTVETSFTEQFEFSGDRCLSSVITLYTPEFLVIFAVRVLLYLGTWSLARRGKPWILAGFRPSQPFRGGFAARWHQLAGPGHTAGCDDGEPCDQTEAPVGRQRPDKVCLHFWVGGLPESSP